MHKRHSTRLATAALVVACATMPVLAATPPAAPPPPAKPASPAPAAKPPASGFALDEYVVTTAWTSNSFQLGAGLQFGNSIGPHWWWFAGGRLSWVQGERPGDLANAAALGVVGGFGFRPEKRFSPIARVGFDSWLWGDDSFERQSNVSAGVRLRVSPGQARYYAISFEAYRSTLYGGNGVADESDFGILLAYSVAFQQKR